MKIILLVTVFVVLGHVEGECPRMDDVPVMYNPNYFSCFAHWRGEGGSYAVNSCNGKSLLFINLFNDVAR